MIENIVIKDLIKVYKAGKSEVIALRGLDCELAGGHITAIMGPSGCGKTTLLNMIGGLDRPTAGSIRVNGTNIIDLTDAELVKYRRMQVGLVFQFFNLVSTLTAEENIELPMRLAGTEGKKRTARTEELLKIVGLEGRRNHKPDELSGGEQQRVGIATALANDPPLILADEPTGELDTKTGREILELFRELRDRYGKTLIIVTHDTRIGKIADKILTIVDGRITGEIPKEQIPALIAQLREESPA